MEFREMRPWERRSLPRTLQRLACQSVLSFDVNEQYVIRYAQLTSWVRGIRNRIELPLGYRRVASVIQGMMRCALREKKRVVPRVPPVSHFEDELRGVEAIYGPLLAIADGDKLRGFGVEIDGFVLAHRGHGISFDWAKVGYLFDGGGFADTPEDSHSYGAGHRHPHVYEDGGMCLGDADQLALSLVNSGRLCDLMDTLCAVLHTYNEKSPYADIETWFGTPCSGCGEIPDEDDLHTCEDCGCNVCNECSRTERGNTYCLSHYSTCPMCGERRLDVCDRELIDGSIVECCDDCRHCQNERIKEEENDRVREEEEEEERRRLEEEEYEEEEPENPQEPQESEGDDEPDDEAGFAQPQATGNEIPF